MTDNDRLKLIQELAKGVTDQVIAGLLESVRCCPHCTHWLETPELCANVINCPAGPARPPANIIAFGCDHFNAKAPF